MNFNSFSEIRKDVQEGRLTATAVVNHFLQQIEKHNDLNAFTEVFAEDALQQAKIIDEKIKKGSARRLAGMVIGIKDNICYKDHKTEASSAMLKGFKPIYHATAVERLLSEDVIIIGRLNCDEFAMGGSNEHSAYGPSLNPYNKKYVTGGSSGGSAAAVAARLCHAALGSDTGGSVRQPGAFCGVCGLKPTYGRISRHGLIAFGSSFDQIGTLTQNTDDAALLLEVMAGHDANDSTSSREEVPAYTNQLPLTRKLKMAVIREAIESKGLDDEIRDSFKKLVSDLQEDGHTVGIVDFELLDHMVADYYILTTAEASSNLSRYSGLLYGHRSQATNSPDESLSKSRSGGFGAEVKRRILLGTFVLSSGYYDAYYEKAQRVRRKIADETSKIFHDYDLILSPVSPSTAFATGTKQDPVAMYLEDIYTVHANLTGLPALAFPAGLHSNGLPYGFQVMANPFNEVTLLQFSKYIEELSPVLYPPNVG